MLLNIAIPLVSFSVTLCACYLLRRVGLWELIGSSLVAGAASLATQAVTSTGLFAGTSTSPHLPATPESAAPGTKPSNQPATPSAVQESEIRKLLDNNYRQNLGHNRAGRGIDAEFVRKIFAQYPGSANNMNLMMDLMATAVVEGNEKCIEVLLEDNPRLAFAEMKTEAFSGPLLFNLLRCNDLHAASYLLKHFPSVADQRGQNGKTALQFAIDLRNLASIRLVAETCPDLLLQVDQDGRNALGYVMVSRLPEASKLEFVQYILEKSPRLALVKNREGKTMAECLREPGFFPPDQTETTKELLKLLDEAARKATMTGTTGQLPHFEMKSQLHYSPFNNGGDYSVYAPQGIPNRPTAKRRDV